MRHGGGGLYIIGRRGDDTAHVQLWRRKEGAWMDATISTQGDEEDDDVELATPWSIPGNPDPDQRIPGEAASLHRQFTVHGEWL